MSAAFAGVNGTRRSAKPPRRRPRRRPSSRGWPPTENRHPPADRDRCARSPPIANACWRASRALERSLEDVTGSIKQQAAAPPSAAPRRRLQRPNRRRRRRPRHRQTVPAEADAGGRSAARPPSAADRRWPSLRPQPPAGSIAELEAIQARPASRRRRRRRQQFRWPAHALEQHASEPLRPVRRSAPVVAVRENSKSRTAELRLVAGPLTDVDIASADLRDAGGGQALLPVGHRSRASRWRWTTPDSPAPAGGRQGRARRSPDHRSPDARIAAASSARRHSRAAMQATFFPTARQTNWLLIVGFLAIGEALYLRYLAIEYAPVSLACQGGLQTWLCTTLPAASSRSTITACSAGSALGAAAAQSGAAVDRADVGRDRRRRLRAGAAQRRSCRARGGAADPQPGAARAGNRLTASATRPAQNHSACQLAKRFVEHDVDRAQQQASPPRPSRRSARMSVARRPAPSSAAANGIDRAGQRRERKIAVARIEHQAERRLHRQHHQHDQQARRAQARAGRAARRRGARACCAKLGTPVPPATPRPRRRSARRARPPPMPASGSSRPTVRLSIGTFAIVQPISVPDTTRNRRNAQPDPRRRRRSPPARRQRGARTPARRSATPPAACQRQCGWLETGAAPGELGLALVGVVEAPMAADGAFELALPGLVVGLDQVDAIVLALAERHHLVQHARRRSPATARRLRACARRSASRTRRERSPCRETRRRPACGSHRRGAPPGRPGSDDPPSTAGYAR